MNGVDVLANKIEELGNNEQFIERLSELKTPEEVMFAFKEHSVDIGLADAERFLELSKTGEEFDESELDNVTGGSVAAAACIVAVMGVCAIKVYSYQKAKVKTKRK